MNEHVAPSRLFELARLDFIFDEPEWTHMKACEVCLDKFAVCVREIHEKDRDQQAS